MAREYFAVFVITLSFVIGVESSLENFYRNVDGRALRIYNGRTASPQKYRWMAWLYNEHTNAMVCGGTLVDNGWVVTTATCAGKEFDDVVVGDFNLYEPDGEQCIMVDRVVIHPGYNATTSSNDIAMLRLRILPDFSDDRVDVMRRLSSYELDALTPTTCMVTGWGLLLSENWQWPTATKLQELRVILHGDTDCEDQGLDLSETSMCFSAVRRHASPCMRDEGSPVVCKFSGNKWYLVGMYSYAREGDGCKLGPKAATRISGFRSWIRKTIQSDNVRINLDDVSGGVIHE